MGNDQTLVIGGATGGQFQLNIMMPVMGHTALESVELLAGAVDVFAERCARGMEANREACEGSVEMSLSMVTSLNPLIGYEKASALAKEAFQTGKTIRQLCLEQNVLPREELDKALDPWRMTEPQE
jgi:fumarate hydratase class II